MKTIKLECRTWSDLRDAKIKKPDGNFETFNEVIQRLVKDENNILLIERKNDKR